MLDSKPESELGGAGEMAATAAESELGAAGEMAATEAAAAARVSNHHSSLSLRFRFVLFVNLGDLGVASFG